MNIIKPHNYGLEQSEHRLLCILAHPDDESLGFGGILAHYAQAGVATYLITATRGERGWLGEPAAYPGAAILGNIREGELLAAANILGIQETTFLDYMDGDLDQANPVAIIDLLVGHLRRVRPQVVVTFDPTGVYGHPDHIAICQFTTAAISAAANPRYVDRDGQAPHQVHKLYYRAFRVDELAIYQQVFGDLVMTVDGVERRATGWAEWAITTRIDAVVHWQQVRRAVACHRSQLRAYQHFTTLPPEQQHLLWGNQTFYRALSMVNGGRHIEHDLFAGITDEAATARLRTEPMAGMPVALSIAINGAAFN